MPLKVLTANVDLQFTEVCVVSAGKLHDEISVRRQTAGAVQSDCSPVFNLSRVLTTDCVVPQGRCRDNW